MHINVPIIPMTSVIRLDALATWCFMNEIATVIPTTNASGINYNQNDQLFVFLSEYDALFTANP